MALEAQHDSIPVETHKVALSSSPSSATLATNILMISSADKGSDQVNHESSPATETTPKVKEVDLKSPRGWPQRVPFRTKIRSSQSIVQKYIFWSELTLEGEAILSQGVSHSIPLGNQTMFPLCQKTLHYDISHKSLEDSDDSDSQHRQWFAPCSDTANQRKLYDHGKCFAGNYLNASYKKVSKKGV